MALNVMYATFIHDDVIKWKHFPRYWQFLRGIHRSPVNSPHKGQWRGPLMLSLICTWINGWVNNRESGDLRRHRALYDVIVMIIVDPPGLCYIELTLMSKTDRFRLKIALGVFYVGLGTFLFVSSTTGNVMDFMNGVRMGPEVICV